MNEALTAAICAMIRTLVDTGRPEGMTDAEYFDALARHLAARSPIAATIGDANGRLLVVFLLDGTKLRATVDEFGETFIERTDGTAELAALGAGN